MRLILDHMWPVSDYMWPVFDPYSDLSLLMDVVGLSLLVKYPSHARKKCMGYLMELQSLQLDNLAHVSIFLLWISCNVNVY